MLTSFSDPALSLAPRSDPTLEPLIVAIEQQLQALGAALRDGDAQAIDSHSKELQRSLAAAVQRFTRLASQPGGIPPALRQRLITAGGLVAAQRENLARATAALDRAIDVLLPASAARAAYDAGGQAERQARGGSTHA